MILRQLTFLLILVLLLGLLPASGRNLAYRSSNVSTDEVLPKEGYVLPAKWGGLGYELVQAGAIDREKFLTLYERTKLYPEAKQLLDKRDNGNLKITAENSGLILNILWAFGLANKNPVLGKGPMMDERYGGAGNFVSTGGWTLARGEAMDHYNRHELVKLSPAEQALVERVSNNIYRPCCDNSTYFPDCNHGMAMLGLLELMARDGAREAEIYQATLYANAFWFPDTYEIIAKYSNDRGQNFWMTDPKKLLHRGFSSASGFRNIAAKVKPASVGGSSCNI